MRTFYEIITVSGMRLEREVEWPKEPRYELIRDLVCPLLGGGFEPLEHVSVLHNGARADMFVSEIGRQATTERGPLPINSVATDIYRANWMKQHPECDPDTLPTIAGVAVLFDRIVWT
jgi:hypothetical protein